MQMAVRTGWEHPVPGPTPPAAAGGGRWSSGACPWCSAEAAARGLGLKALAALTWRQGGSHVPIRCDAASLTATQTFRVRAPASSQRHSHRAARHPVAFHVGSWRRQACLLCLWAHPPAQRTARAA